MRASLGWAVVSVFGLSAACGDDFEPSDNPVDAGGGNAGSSAGSGGTAGGSGGTAGGSGGSSGAGAGGTAGADAGDGAVQCGKASDCGAGQICDPDTKNCAPPECTDAKPCASNERCWFQNEEGTIGVCFPTCQLAGPPCANGATCVPSSGGPNGTCIPAGTMPAGAECTPSGIDTGCMEDLICQFIESDGFGTAGLQVCRGTCDAWGATKTCDPSFGCFLGGCGSDSAGAGVGVGQECTGSSQLTPCANDGVNPSWTWKGICLDLATGGAGPTTCYALCRVGQSDCTGGTTCNPISASVGYCD